MHEQIEARRNELKRQLDEGQIELQQVQARENYLREAILRISGALQVLEELLIQRQTTDPSRANAPEGEPTAGQVKEADVSRSKAARMV